MRKLRKIVLAIAAITIANGGILHAENGNRSGNSTAVMEMRVEVVSASAIMTSNNHVLMTRNSSDNTVESDYLGDITISVQEGTEIITEFHDVVRMNNEKKCWNLKVDITEYQNGSAKTYSISGKSNGDEVSDGAYKGTQIAVIQYL